MTFKRPRLRPGRSLVNAGTALCLTFLAACGQGEDDIADKPVPGQSEAAGPSAAPVALPAVWGTPPLAGRVSGLAFSGGPGPVLAIGYEGGALQFFDLNGEPLSQPADMGLAALADGRSVLVDEVALTVFPGTGRDGAINLYAWNSVLGSPVALPLIEAAGAAGLCAAPASGDGAVLRLAYWTSAAPSELRHGLVSEADGAFVFAETGTEAAGDSAPIRSCLLGEQTLLGTAITGGPLISISGLSSTEIMAATRLGLVRQGDGARGSLVRVTEGITIRPPAEITAAAALSDVRFGGYPDGVIAIAGETAPGEHRVVFLEPGPLFAPVN